MSYKSRVVVKVPSDAFMDTPNEMLSTLLEGLDEIGIELLSAARSEDDSEVTLKFYNKLHNKSEYLYYNPSTAVVMDYGLADKVHYTPVIPKMEVKLHE